MNKMISLVLIEILQHDVQIRQNICYLITILVLVENSLQSRFTLQWRMGRRVTILVLVENSLQYYEYIFNKSRRSRHNPCFSRKPFAI